MTPKAKISIFAVSLLAISLIIVNQFFNDEEKVISKTAIYMGTTVGVKVSMTPPGKREEVDRAIEKAFREIGRVEGVFSVFRKESEISKINRLKANETLKISDEVFHLIEKSVEFTIKTEGAFDITVKPLVDLWNTAKSDRKIPSVIDIDKAGSRVGSENIVLDKEAGTISFKRDGVMLDMGGIAKGYATYKAMEVLKANGIRNAIVNSGGDMYCLGVRAKNKPWKVGIQHPRKNGGVLMNIILEGKAVDTSGDYEKYFTLDGKRFSHIIDPRTGYPIGDKTVSATVVAPDPVTADAIATALCILGPEKGLVAIRSFPGVDAAIVSNEDGSLKVRVSDGFKKYTDEDR